MTQRNIRIKDIAKIAGVSEGTVDRILHGRPNVSAKALAKVNEVLDKINYKPNLIARSLGKGKNIRIGVLIPEGKGDPYWSAANAGIARAKEDWSHYGITIDSFDYTHDGMSSLENLGDEILKLKTNGVVIAPIFYQQALPFLEKLNKIKVPYILFNDNIPESQPLSFIGQDLFQSGMLAGQLMSLGRETNEELVILHMGEDIVDSVYLIEKEEGFREFFKGKANEGVKITSLNLGPNENSFVSHIEKLLKNKSVKGLFVTTSKDISTVATILYKHQRKDIRLIGYDMLEENRKFLKMGIINFLINQNPKRQAFLGISHMVNHLLFKKEIPKTELFPLEIITKQNVDSYIASAIH